MNKAVAHSYRITTLGCRVNKADSISMEREFADMGYTKATPGEIPDLWVVNTCAVTAEAMRKSRKAVRKYTNSGADVIVTGCASELEPAVFEKTYGVRTVVKNREKSELVSKALEAEDNIDEPISWKCDQLLRIPLKVQDGCRRFCTYCVVPYLRGEPRSKALPDVVKDVRELRDAGASEVVICGIDLGSYSDPESGAVLEDLVERVMENAGDMWVRLSSIELSDVSDRMLGIMNKENALRKYLHVPLQSGDDDVLHDMGRNYSPEWFSGRIAEISDAVPDVGISTDVMVGFPTETEEAFLGTSSLMEEIGFSRVHVFRYSPRPLTEAFTLEDQVSSATKYRRADELRRIASESTVRFHSGMVGRIILVLVEGTMESEPGFVFGRAENFAGLAVRGNQRLIGKRIPVRVTGLGSQWLRGEPV